MHAVAALPVYPGRQAQLATPEVSTRHWVAVGHATAAHGSVACSQKVPLKPGWHSQVTPSTVKTQTPPALQGLVVELRHGSSFPDIDCSCALICVRYIFSSCKIRSLTCPKSLGSLVPASLFLAQVDPAWSGPHSQRNPPGWGRQSPGPHGDPAQ